VIWEVMARDAQLEVDLRRARCRLDTFAFFKGRDVNDHLRTGQLQGGIGGDLPALKAASESDIRIVSLIQQGPCSIVAREALPLEKLRGRRVGYAPGSNAHYTLLRALRDHGVRPTDVRLVPMDVTEMAEALASKRIEAFSAWEPAPTLALADHPNFEVLERKDARGYIYFTRDFFDRQPAVVRAIIAAEIRALSWLRRNDKNVYVASRWARERAVAFAGAELPLTAYDFHRLARRDILRVPTAPRFPADLLSPAGELYRQFRLSQEFGLIAADARWDRLRQSFAVDVVPELQRSALGAPRSVEKVLLLPSAERRAPSAGAQRP
jgi:NitT/TauT family transport system substrate-binding protein